jgi:dimethylargininase
MGLIALTREVSPTLAACELTHIARTPIDVERARAQHEAYEACLRALGCDVRRLPPEPHMPDAVFVEDTAVVLPELAVITHPGAASRRRETASAAAALHAFRPLVRTSAPATLDGGDVLVCGRRVYVGLSTRTNAAAAEQMRAALGPHGYDVRALAVSSVLHLKSAATAVGAGTVLLNPQWIDAGAFAGLERIEVDPREPLGANALDVGGTLVYAEAFPRTRERLQRRGLRVRTVAMDELAKAEGAVTCCSLVFEEEPSAADGAASARRG